MPKRSVAIDHFQPVFPLSTGLGPVSSPPDEEGFDEALRGVLPAVDTVENRLWLAQAVLALRDNGRVSPTLAAVAVIDLNQTDSAFLLSSLAQSLAVRSGDERTPSGLLIAAP